jgi:polysaccharide biosynthesis transport protein
MEIRNYLTILWRRMWVIIVTLVVTMSVVIVGTFSMTPIYSATGMLRIASAASGAVNYSDYMYADRLLNTYVTISTSKVVLDELQSRLGLSTLPEINVTTLPNTELIQITVTDEDPNQAAKIVNTLAEILISQSTQLYAGGGQSSIEILSNQVSEMENEVNQARKEYEGLVASNPNDTGKIQIAQQTLDLKQKFYTNLLDQYEQARLNEALREKSISLAQPAYPPVSPSKPKKVLNIALGFMVGLIGGLGLAFLFENLDTTIYTREQIEDLIKLPNLGMVPNSKVQKKFLSTSGSNPYIDAFRRIRTSIFRLDMDKHPWTLMVTSSAQREGKSTIVTNLAFVLAQAEQKVIVVDCDLRLPTQHKQFNLPNELGISNVLMQKNNLEEAIQKTKTPGLCVLTSGTLPRNPSELLGSDQMSEVFDQLRKSFDFILIDTPAMLGATDAEVLAPHMDGVILVVSRGISHRKDVLTAYRHLEDNKSRMIGYIFNRAKENHNYYYYKRKTSLLERLS